MDDITCISLLTFVTSCWFSCKTAAGQQPGKLSSYSGLDVYSLCNQMHLKTFSREKSAVMGRSLYLPAVQGEIPEKSKAQCQHSRADQEIPFLWTRKVQRSLLWLWKLLVIVEWSKDGREGVVLWVAREDTFFFKSCNFFCSMLMNFPCFKGCLWSHETYLY